MPDSSGQFKGIRVPSVPWKDDECQFCQGRPVGDAASWVDGKPRPPAPCPRCGKVNHA
jgi:hypothetical protein